MPWRTMPLAPVAIAFAFGVGIAPWVRADVAWTTCLAALASAGALLLAGRTSRAAALLLAGVAAVGALRGIEAPLRSEEHTSELQSHSDLVCRLLLVKKKQRKGSCDINRHFNSPAARC